MTHTYVELEVHYEVYGQIARLLREAGYKHAFMEGGALDMHGTAIVRDAAEGGTDSPLAKARKLKGWSREEMGEKCGLPVTEIAALENPGVAVFHWSAPVKALEDAGCVFKTVVGCIVYVEMTDFTAP